MDKLLILNIVARVILGGSLAWAFLIIYRYRKVNAECIRISEYLADVHAGPCPNCGQFHAIETHMVIKLTVRWMLCLCAWHHPFREVYKLYPELKPGLTDAERADLLISEVSR